MKNLGQMLKQVQDMQGRMQQMQESLGETEVTGTSGGGMVTLTMNGKGEARSLRIDPALLKPDEREVLEDLVVAAINDARARVDQLVRDKTAEIMGGLQLPPGVTLPF